MAKCQYCGVKMIKHIYKEDSRYHVHSYSTLGIHCSEPNCEDNHKKNCEKRYKKNNKTIK